jgi:glucose 1-dehydrogenase
MRLEGKVAVITGAARGIGRATALELAQQGADVVVFEREHVEEAESLRSQILALHRRAIAVFGDVANRQDDERCLAETVNAFGHLDILVNNAAHNVRRQLLDLEIEDVKRIWDVTLWGTFHWTQLAAQQMAQQGRGGAVIIVGSVLAHLSAPNSSIYNGAKAALVQMASTWAVELAQYKIRVNVVEPGWINTPGERAFFTEQQLLDKGKSLLLGRLGTPEEIARGVLFLASEENSAYVTGSCLRIDGGFTLAPPKFST